MVYQALRLAKLTGEERSRHGDAVLDLDRTTERILKSFNTWAFKREQPTEPEMLAQVVANTVLNARPLAFVLYWGKGPRAHVAAPDLTCLDFLASMRQRITAAYGPGARFHLCQTDTHARLNGHSEESITSYFDDVTVAARARGMATHRLSRLTEGLTPLPLADATPDPGILDSLERCATRWYRGAGGAREGARTYLAMNHVESSAIAAHFPASVFITFNGRSYRKLFPASLPVFYMYSLKRGTAVKPWFMDEEGVPYDGAGDMAGA